MALFDVGLDRPNWFDVAQVLLATQLINGYFALRLLKDARKRGLRLTVGRLFAVATLLTSFLGVAAYMCYEIATRRRVRREARGPRATPGTGTLLVELMLAAAIVALVYLVVTRAILLSQP